MVYFIYWNLSTLEIFHIIATLGLVRVVVDTIQCPEGKTTGVKLYDAGTGSKVQIIM